MTGTEQLVRAYAVMCGLKLQKRPRDIQDVPDDIQTPLNPASNPNQSVDCVILQAQQHQQTSSPFMEDLETQPTQRQISAKKKKLHLHVVWSTSIIQHFSIALSMVKE